MGRAARKKSMKMKNKNSGQPINQSISNPFDQVDCVCVGVFFSFSFPFALLIHNNTFPTSETTLPPVIIGISSRPWPPPRPRRH